MSGRGGKAVDGRAHRGGKRADSGAEGRTGPTRRRHADERKRRGRGPGGADGRMGGLGGRGLHCADGGSGERTDGRMSGWAWI